MTARSQTTPAPEHVVFKAAPEPHPIIVEESLKAPEPIPAIEAASASVAPSAAQLQARTDTAIALAQSSSAEALRWAKSLPAAERAKAIVAAANEVARTKPAEALAALADLEPSFERDTALAHAASQWAAVDPKSAVEWAAEGVPGELREQLCSAVAIALSNRDPQAAAEFLAAQMADGIPLHVATVSVAQRWAQKDGPAAKAWVQQFPAGSLREEALREIEVQTRAAALRKSRHEKRTVLDRSWGLHFVPPQLAIPRSKPWKNNPP